LTIPYVFSMLRESHHL